MSVVNTDSPEVTIKDQIRSIVDGLPNDCTVEDVQYQLLVLAQIRRGLESLERGEEVSHDEVKRRMEKWLSR
jgi:predicted transcriptional regulator